MHEVELAELYALVDCEFADAPVSLFASEEEYSDTRQNIAGLINSFDAAHECKEDQTESGRVDKGPGQDVVDLPVPKRAEGEQRHGHDNHESQLRARQILELTTPFEVIARRQLNLCDLRLRFLNERTGIASAEIDLDDHAPLAVLTTDLIRPHDMLDLGHSAQWDMPRWRMRNTQCVSLTGDTPLTLRQRHGQITQGLNVVTQGVG